MFFRMPFVPMAPKPGMQLEYLGCIFSPPTVHYSVMTVLHNFLVGSQNLFYFPLLASALFLTRIPE